MRIDKLLYLRGFVPSRTRAASLIAEGSVTANGCLIKKPSEDIPENALIIVEENEALHYVGRGALKLRAAFEMFRHRSRRNDRGRYRRIDRRLYPVFA